MGQLTERPLAGALAHPAIGYYTRPSHDLIADLNHRIEDGTARIAFDDTSGYLTSVLAALRVPAESQMLVMSKTGVQALYTSPAHPRAIFFNDAVSVGYIRGAPLLELAVHDPEQGVLFYTIEQKPQPRPLFERRPACLSCHQNYSTLHVPGLLVRSVFMAPDGLPLAQFGSYDADDRTPYRRRWGGWYVTGADAALGHIGNAFVTDREKREAVVADDTLHRIAPDAVFDGRGYLSAQSDVAALMVFAHQAHMTNLLTRLGWETRIAVHEGRAGFDAPPLRDTVDELVDYLLFVDEPPLPSPIGGSPVFAARFAASGPADKKGRSLRQLDLDRRLMRYPCSYMVYSAAFVTLPPDARRAVYVRMWDVLSGRDTSPRYARLSAADRGTVVDLLRETVHDLPTEFR
ncbi:MAG: hypothetical protein JWL71_4410 [Acidobacteria bacterium]|nr:hypothetical protein [Acidobacteriota bacterium]